MNKYKSIGLAVDKIKDRILTPTSNISSGRDTRTDNIFRSTGRSGTFSKIKDRIKTGNATKTKWDFGDKFNKGETEYSNKYVTPNSRQGNSIVKSKPFNNNNNLSNTRDQKKFTHTGNTFYSNHNTYTSNDIYENQIYTKLPQIKTNLPDSRHDNNSISARKVSKTRSDNVPYSLINALKTDNKYIKTNYTVNNLI